MIEQEEVQSLHFPTWEAAFQMGSLNHATIMVPLDAFKDEADKITEAASRHGFSRVLDTEDEAMYVQVH